MKFNRKYHNKFYKSLKGKEINFSDLKYYKFVKIKDNFFIDSLKERYSSNIEFYDKIHAETFVNSLEFLENDDIMEIANCIISLKYQWDLQINNKCCIIHSFNKFNSIKLYNFDSSSNYLLNDIESYMEPVAEFCDSKIDEIAKFFGLHLI